jgi:hypothetical protein
MIALVLVGLMSIAPGAPLDNGPVAITADAVEPGNPDQTTSPPPSVQGRVRLSFGNRLGENPFGNVFTRSRSVGEGVPARQLTPGTAAARRRVVCGLTIWEVDPEFDPNMRRVTPEQDIQFAIRRIIPSVCLE